MENIYFAFGLASLQLPPIFTLVYLQNEIATLSNIIQNIPSKILTILGMISSFGLVFINLLTMGHSVSTMNSILLIVTLSLSVNYTYKDYTIDEGYYITIPYFIIYSSFIFFIGIIEYPLFIIESFDLSMMLLCSFTCYLLFSTSSFLGIEFHTSYLNYIAFIGLAIGTYNLMLILNSNKNIPMKFIIHFLTLQLMHIYLYLAHLLSVKF
ncbi:unnamed protein product [Rotaria magnacalcarata]|uniref:Uncharacterized protein n=1 Tax=Rotaria magnacalcarata TaxID=392030 RepID=A0A816NUA7_9BILA|nr:unnamed protein product [Rotaria magnacalcarata]